MLDSNTVCGRIRALVNHGGSTARFVNRVRLVAGIRKTSRNFRALRQGVNVTRLPHVGAGARASSRTSSNVRTRDTGRVRDARRTRGEGAVNLTSTRPSGTQAMRATDRPVDTKVHSVLAGFAATWVRVANKLFRPALEETTSYKTWWGKPVMKIFDLVEGELNASDPLSKIFFISDGLMTMLDEKYKLKFARYISNLASEKPDDEIVPDYFVENELRNWLNDKFLLDPPLQPKRPSDKVDDLPFNEIVKEGYKIRTFDPKTNSGELKWHFETNNWDYPRYYYEGDGIIKI